MGHLPVVYFLYYNIGYIIKEIQIFHALNFKKRRQLLPVVFSEERNVNLW